MAKFILEVEDDSQILFLDDSVEPVALQHTHLEKVTLSAIAISGILSREWATINKHGNIVITLRDTTTLCQYLVEKEDYSIFALTYIENMKAIKANEEA